MLFFFYSVGQLIDLDPCIDEIQEDPWEKQLDEIMEEETDLSYNNLLSGSQSSQTLEGMNLKSMRGKVGREIKFRSYQN